MRHQNLTIETLQSTGQSDSLKLRRRLFMRLAEPVFSVEIAQPVNNFAFKLDDVSVSCLKIIITSCCGSMYIIFVFVDILTLYLWIKKKYYWKINRRLINSFLLTAPGHDSDRLNSWEEVTVVFGYYRSTIWSAKHVGSWQLAICKCNLSSLC